MNIKGIIFDLDGTLIDSMEVWSRTDMAFLKECGVKDPPPDVSDEVKKMTVDDSAMYFINRFGLKLSKEYVIDRIEELVRIQYEEKIPLKPYVPQLLDRLDEKGIPYGVATATYKRLAEAVLKRCGIYERFRFVLTDEEYPLGKTCPIFFLEQPHALELKSAKRLLSRIRCIAVKLPRKQGSLYAEYMTVFQPATARR